MTAPTYPIETPRLLVRPFADKDLADMIALYAIPEVLRYLYVGKRPDAEVAKSLAERKAKTALNTEGDKMILAIEEKASGQFVGEVVLVWLSETHRSAEAGFIIHPAFQGQGFAREAILPLLRFGFEVMNFHRIIGRCDGRNAASARLMAKLGMRQEAHLIENEFIKGEWTDELAFALLDREWCALQG
ncbi:GNAT family N-acetyltransferase [Dongia sp.]|uniref:GNAT family N-acetyltransferase n=1 Tax=Dongia sp. TaxID=1977262 RepID=UPI0035AE5DE8